MTKILVVDDRKDHRTWIADVLRLEGYDVVEAESGQKALDLLAQGGVDLITLDELMPSMSGMKCYERIHQDEQLQGIPVIFITVLGQDRRFVELRRQGVRVLTKPLSYREIAKAVASALEQGRG